MSEPYEEVKKFWEYALFYPDEDEDGFDGVHYGGIEGLREDAPLEAVKAYEVYVKKQEKYRKKGIKV